MDRYTYEPHTQNYENYSTFSSSTYWVPNDVPLNSVSTYDTYEWASSEFNAPPLNVIEFPMMSHGDNVYGRYLDFQPHAPLERWSAPLERWSATEDLHNQTETTPFDEFPRDDYAPSRNNTYMQFHVQDEALIIDLNHQILPSIDYEDFHSQVTPANVGISDETIERYLEKKTYDSSTNISKEAPNLNSSHDICVVCQGEYGNKDEIGILRCGHEYHINCIKPWLKKKNECPMCRAAFLELENQ